MQRFWVLCLQFYKPFWWYHLLFSAIGLSIIAHKGAIAFLTTVFFKIAGYASAAAYQYYFNENVYYYYRNAGYTVRKLYICTTATDFLVFLLFTALCLYLKSI
jgi:hypothetical protein